MSVQFCPIKLVLVPWLQSTLWFGSICCIPIVQFERVCVAFVTT
jgi:hypothetical protein